MYKQRIKGWIWYVLNGSSNNNGYIYVCVKLIHLQYEWTLLYQVVHTSLFLKNKNEIHTVVD